MEKRVHARLDVARRGVTENGGGDEHADAAEERRHLHDCEGSVEVLAAAVDRMQQQKGDSQKHQRIDPGRGLPETVFDLEAEDLAERHRRGASRSAALTDPTRAPWWPAITLK